MTRHAPAASILLVEDNPVDIDLTLRAFRKKRLDSPIELARDGEEALAYMDRWEAGDRPPALILLDIQLPKVSGLDVLRRLKSHERLRRIPVVMLTSSREEQDLQRAYDLGVNSYIEKPLEYARFLDVAEQIQTYWCVLNERHGTL